MKRGQKAVRSLRMALIAFILGQLALSFAVETVCPQWRDPEFGWRWKAIQAMLRTQGTRPLIIAFGSSRTQMGLSPHDMDQDSSTPAIFNFGQSGGGPIYSYLNLRRLLDSGIKPSAVLVELMPATLSYQGTTETFFHDNESRLSLADLHRLAAFSRDPNAMLERWLTYRTVPWYSLRFLLLSHWQPGLLPWQKRIDFQWRLMDDRGWARFPFETVDDSLRRHQTDQARCQYESKLQHFGVSEVARSILSEIARVCEEQGIPLAFYRMPEGSEFRSWMSAAGRESLNQYLETLAFETSAPIFDFSDWLPDSAFVDGHHILPGSAREFSRGMGRTIFSQWPIRNLKMASIHSR